MDAAMPHEAGEEWLMFIDTYETNGNIISWEVLRETEASLLVVQRERWNANDGSVSSLNRAPAEAVFAFGSSEGPTCHVGMPLLFGLRVRRFGNAPFAEVT